MIEVKNIGIEVEYLRGRSDSIPNKVPEYYIGMYEINDLMIPVVDNDILSALRSVRNILVGINSKLTSGLATYTWTTGYGTAFNGLHLHLDAIVDIDTLTNNLLWVVNKNGITPRIATSWHVKQVVSDRPWKVKSTFRPVIHTSFGTTEIRLLDIEYFYTDNRVKDIAYAISAALVGESITTDTSWFFNDTPNEDVGHWLNTLEGNLASWYKKVGTANYINRYSTRNHSFIDFDLCNYQNILQMGSTPNRLVLRGTNHDIKLPECDNDNVVDSVLITINNSNFKLPVEDELSYIKATEKSLSISLVCSSIPTRLNDTYVPYKNDAFLYLGYEVAISISGSGYDNIDEYKVSELLNELGVHLPSIGNIGLDFVNEYAGICND